MSPLMGAANLLVCLNADAGNLAYHLLKIEAGRNAWVEPFLPNASTPVNTLTSSSPVQRIVTMAASPAIEAHRNAST